MTKVYIGSTYGTGFPLYDMKQLFNIKGSFNEVKISYITIPPGSRIPLESDGVHEEDEYSVFVEGEVYTESGDFKGVCKVGEATLIPRGESHWCENTTNEPCSLICALVK